MRILRLIALGVIVVIGVGTYDLYKGFDFPGIVKPKKVKLTRKDALEVFNKIRANLDREGRTIKFRYINKPRVNASADRKGYVNIYQGIIDLAQSKDELALIIGHEIAHHTLAHVEYAVKNRVGPYGTKGRFLDSQYFEAMADLAGAAYIIKAGYDACAGVALWERFADKYGNNVKNSTTHPNVMARSKSFMPYCVKR